MALNDDVFIRSFQPNDLLQCQNIIRSVYQDYGHIDDYVERTIKSDMADIQVNYLNIPGGHWWVAIHDKQHIIGQIAIQPLAIGDEKCYQDMLTNRSYSSAHIHLDQICELRRFAVLLQYQRRQVGCKLVQTLIDFAKSFGYKAIHLTTLTSMIAACQFYNKYGFTRGKIEQYNIEFDSDNKIKFTKSTVFETFLSLTEDDHRLLDVSMFESHRIYVQHYWLSLH